MDLQTFSDLPPDSPLLRPARDPFPMALAILLAVVMFGSLVGLLVYSLHIRNTKGAQVIGDFQHLTPEQVRRIVIQPAMGEGRSSALAPDPQSLGKADVVIEDEYAIQELVTAFRAAKPAASYSQRDFLSWRCTLLVVTPNRTYQCKVNATDSRGTVLEFWSNGLSGWALGTIGNDSLKEIIPRLSGLKPPN